MLILLVYGIYRNKPHIFRFILYKLIKRTNLPLSPKPNAQNAVSFYQTRCGLYGELGVGGNLLLVILGFGLVAPYYKGLVTFTDVYTV